jgi:hypothetical protein
MVLGVMLLVLVLMAWWLGVNCFPSTPGNCFSRLYSLFCCMLVVSPGQRRRWMVWVVFYQQPLEHRVQTKITELFYPLKLLVFMDLGTLVIVVVLGWFDGLWS